MNKSELQDQINEMKDKTNNIVERIVVNTNLSNPDNTNLLLANSIFTVQLAGSNSKKKRIGRGLQNSVPDMNDIALNLGLSQVDLSSCENKIRESYNISDDKFIILKKSDFDSEINLDSLNNPFSSNLLSFSFFDPETRKKYDTNLCKESNVSLFFPLKKEASSQLNLNKYYNLASENVNIYDSQNPAFQSRCVRLRDNSTNYDTTINFRRTNYFANKTVNCGAECRFSEIDLNEYVNCQCNIADNKEFANSFEDIVLNSLPSFNYEIFICAQEVFVFPDLYNNLGFRYTICNITFTFLLIFILSFKKFKLDDKDLENILYYECEFYNPKNMTPEEYFESKKFNFNNNICQQTQTTKFKNEKNYQTNDNHNKAIIYHNKISSENISININKYNQEENLENQISIINITNFNKIKLNVRNDNNENIEKKENDSFTSRNRFIEIQNNDNKLILKDNKLVNSIDFQSNNSSKAICKIKN